MSLRAQSQLSNTIPAQGQIPSWLSQRAGSLGGGKGSAGSMPQQANPQSAMIQQLMQAMQARRAQQMQQASQGVQGMQGLQQAPAFMSPAQRLAMMPQQSIAALTQAAPQPFFGTQPTAQMPALPGVQAQQAQQAATSPVTPQPTAPATPAAPAQQWQTMQAVPREYLDRFGARDFFTWDRARNMWHGKDGFYYRDAPGGFGGEGEGANGWAGPDLSAGLGQWA